MPATYPILLDLRDKRIVIVGGGAVGLRKAVKLVDGGANDLTVVSPQFADGFPASVRKVTAEFEPGQLAGAALVFAATDSAQVNAIVVAEARRRHAWVCRADEEAADFTVPAVLREGTIVVGVWAESPALSAAIRDGLRKRWDDRWTKMAQAMQSLRPLILQSGIPPRRRRELLRELATDAALERLAGGGIEAMRLWIVEQIQNAPNHP